jgi:YbbR domain-containing protein
MAIKSKENQKMMVVIISIVLAFLLWLYVMGEKNPLQQRLINDVPVTLTNVESMVQDNLVLMPNQTYNVDLSITGRALDIYYIKASDIKLEADMSGSIKKGNNNIPVRIKSSPKGITVNGKNGPLLVSVKLDVLVNKTVPVIINIRGNVKDGYGYIKPIIRPVEVAVSGPEAFVKSVVTATGQIDISDNYANINGSISVVPQDKQGIPILNVTVLPKFIDTTVLIKPSKDVPIKVGTIGTLNSNKILMDIRPQLDRISIIGDKKIIDKINDISTKPINLSKLLDSSTLVLKLDIPRGVNILGGTRSINVDVSVENKIVKTMNVQINAINKDSSFNYSLSMDTVSVEITGPESIVNSIDSKNISATVDVKGILEGAQMAPITIGQIEGISIKTINSDNVMITAAKK